MRYEAGGAKLSGGLSTFLAFALSASDSVAESLDYVAAV